MREVGARSISIEDVQVFFTGPGPEYEAEGELDGVPLTPQALTEPTPAERAYMPEQHEWLAQKQRQEIAAEPPRVTPDLMQWFAQRPLKAPRG